MKTKNVIRVILADDHAMIRRGIRRILEKGTDIVVIAEVDKGTEAIRLVQELKADVLVLDIEMPDMKGYNVARALRKAHSPVAILILSAFNDQYFVDQIMHEGVDGYLTKDATPENIRAAVHHILEKQRLTIDPMMS